MHLHILFLLLAGLALRAPTCMHITLPITTSASNLILPTDLSLLDPAVLLPELQAIVLTAKFATVSGTYAVAGQYCAPKAFNASRASTLQLPVHGAKHDGNYRSGTCIQASTEQSTGGSPMPRNRDARPLSIDRLGNGVSDHPDAVLVVQTVLEVAILAGIAQEAFVGSL